MTPEDIAAVAEGLSELEAELVLGASKYWGSWMWAVSGDLIQKGIMEQQGDCRRIYTPLGLAVRKHLQERQP